VVERDGLSFAVEVKLKDWRRAASQAFLNTGFFHASLIALPTNPRRRVDMEYLRSLDVGLILPERGSDVSTRPRKSTRRSSANRSTTSDSTPRGSSRRTLRSMSSGRSPFTRRHG